MAAYENDFETEDLDTVVLTMEDDSEVTCAILAIYEAQGRDYISVWPLDENDELVEDADPMIFRYIDHGEEEPELENIEDDDEYEIALDAFEEILDDEEYDED